MKKYLFVAVWLVMVAMVFAQQAVIRDLSGTVELKASGASSYVPANTGDSVSEDTLISTGFKSTALIEAGSTLIAVRPLTRLTLTEIRTAIGTETLNVNMAAGRVKVDVNPPAGTRASVGVSSPTATASVRGTSFEMDLRRIIVVEGRVDYSGKRGGLVVVDAGYDSSVLIDGKVSSPYGNILSGYRPSPPVGYDPFSASSSAGGFTSLYVASKDTQPGEYDGGDGGSAGGGSSGGGGTSSGTSGSGGGGDGDVGGVIVDSW